MRLNLAYTFLRGGCSFFYRDIISGLSNETMGTASYNLPSGKHCPFATTNSLATTFSINQPTMTTALIATYLKRYDVLLTRYAKVYVKDQAAAESIALSVITKFCSEHYVLDNKDERRLFKHSIQLACHRWLHDNALFLLKNQKHLHKFN
jgi:hypothetical protein